ncbi:hypothetical protein [Ottowia testudinis]|uniref:Uncharacterized protein n=1 Tax=Ottowia testudinis TaxID=2816950 RepID=A0A975H3U6_9BURK|nr:hypothetical protein [Ottowia testudinis]QTD45631.1 hypothetical protein J1M35_01520 [Ottowia testudinis]
MGPPQGFAADLRGIANSDLSLADKVRMTHDTIGYYYRNSPAFQGWVQAVGGGVEVLGGMALSSVPGGAVPGSVAIVHGVDNYAAGLNRFYDENAGRTLTYRLVHAATGSPWLADAVDRGIPFTTAVAGGATALGAAQAARPGANAAQWGRVNAGEEAANGAANSGRAISAEGTAFLQSAESPFKGQPLTNAGRATTKHPEYFGFNSTEELRAVYRTDAQLNELASKNLNEILANGTRTSGAGGRYPNGWVTYTLPDGRAASWGASGEFIGFRGVQK